MKCLNNASLRVGDIILVTGLGKTSKGIRLATNSDISHAMIYVEACSIIDSTADGVHARNTQRLFWPDHCAMYVLRLAADLTDEEVQKIVNYARSKVGMRYATADAMRSVLGGGRRRTRREFCSRLVARAYSSAGINLVKSPDYCTPEDLKSSEKLVEVAEATRFVTDHHVETISNDNDTAQLTRDATNRLLTGARMIDSVIEDLGDIDQYVIDHPEHDSRIAQLLRESGYLTVWCIERSKNPWHYDLPLMDAIPIPFDSKRRYCEAVLDDGDAGMQRYEVNRTGYTILYDQFPRESFRALKELYEKLLALHRQRRQVAADWLARYAHTSFSPPETPIDLVPHSTEWFAALRLSNPAQALMTQEIIQATGSVDVCSICGDTPVRDYRLVGHALPAGAARTLRLCNDCWGIRRSMYMESFGLS